MHCLDLECEILSHLSVNRHVVNSFLLNLGLRIELLVIKAALLKQ